MDAAYHNYQGVHFGDDGTLYIAGTRGVGDLVDDLHIPLRMGDRLERYGFVEKLLDYGVRPDRFVGHSMGGVVAAMLGEERGIPFVTYGAPLLRSDTSTFRRRGRFDPVSMLDFGAESRLQMDPHGYARRW